MTIIGRKSKRLANGLGVLQAFIGFGAVGGGLGLVLEPSGANLGIPLELLENSPFATYLIPGIVLLTVNGLGSLVGAAASFTRYQYAGEAAWRSALFSLHGSYYRPTGSRPFTGSMGCISAWGYWSSFWAGRCAGPCEEKWIGCLIHVRQALKRDQHDTIMPRTGMK